MAGLLVVKGGRASNSFALRLVPDVNTSPKGRIAGTVAVKASPVPLPVRRLVRLHRQGNGALVATTVSNATTGAYEFIGIEMTSKYYVVSTDPTEERNAVIKSDVVPELYV